MLPTKVIRALSFLAAAAVIPLLALYVLLMKISMSTPDSGMEPAVSMIAYFAFTILFAVLIFIALNFSRQLGREAKGIRQTP